MLLHVLLEPGVYTCFRFSWTIFRNSALLADLFGTVAVVDGMSVLFTPLAIKNIPPPMSAAKVDFGAAVTHVSFFGEGTEENCLVALNDGQIECLTYQVEGSKFNVVRQWTTR